ncbi:unnamed protein product (macronuclear) [Paramecium tetraurelia]|uniref:Protein kinase domain-containing protein n=1 Tax=Paramecium tetraurelia TaxID=5888 RepID=A0CZY8_PARTE|nr:uncharacterized protein GSPATT00011929001 [Paramecium tetraurelia]CAK76355.1 unnamed protein product [Paramecium tetraurelia]|eukprot:XP_001443752.1 hypothetical protein (macronuclear) [Paramecium tetraurelia strain d4-2]
MGNQQVFVNYDSDLAFIQDLNEQLLDKGTQIHPSLGPIKLWQMKKDPQHQLFSLVIQTSKLDAQLLQVHQQRCKMQHPNLLKYYACSKSIQLGGVEKQQYFFEYSPKTLKQITIQAPLKEEQIWAFVEQIVDVMQYIQSLNKFHGNLTSEAIFIDKQQNAKLLDNLGQKRQNKDSISEDIFQLGLLCLEMMTQRSSQLSFSSALKQLMGKYSLQLLQLTSKLLHKDAEMGLDFVELKNILKNRFQIPITIKQAKIIKTEQGYQSCSSVQIFDKEEINRIKHQKPQNQNQHQAEIINTIKYNQNQNQIQIQQINGNYLQQFKQLHVLPQKQQIDPDFSKKNSIQQVQFNSQKNQQQANQNIQLHRSQPQIIYHKQTASLQLQNSHVTSRNPSPMDRIQFSKVKQPQQPQNNHFNMKQALEILDKIYKNQNNSQQKQSQKLDMRSSIDSSHSTQFYLSQNKRQQTLSHSSHSVIQTPCHRFQSLQARSFQSIHKKQEI